MNKVGDFIKNLPKNVVILLIRVYQLVLSPLLPDCCRFTPTCSEYGLIALRRYGFLKGSALAIKRIIRCRPGGGYGYDPVP